MPSIRLIVTGRVEELALASALKRLFPTATFSTVKKEGATTERLERPRDLPHKVFPLFVEEMLAAGDVERVPGGTPFDHVVVVDDLELGNTERPEIVAEHMVFAATKCLDDLRSSATVPAFPKGKNRFWRYLATDDGRRRYLRDCCSFHLLSPMVESLFFGEHRGGSWPALARAGAVRAPIFDPVVTDIEHFVTSDSAYLTFAEDAAWTRGAAKDPTWRARHPKHYLSFLCDPTGQSARPYRETKGGKAALEILDWESVVAPPEHACLVRSLLWDIADMVGVTVPWLGAGKQHALTSLKRGGVLRNIL